EPPDTCVGPIEPFRIPIESLAALFAAGDTEPVRLVLRRLAAMRSYMRRINLGRERDESLAADVGMTGTEMEEMYRLLALAKYNDRYVIPTAFGVDEADREAIAEIGCDLDFEGRPGMGGMGRAPFGEASGRPDPATVENFHALRSRQSSDQRAPTDGRVNLLNWDGNGRPDGLFPPRPGRAGTDDSGEGEAGGGGRRAVRG